MRTKDSQHNGSQMTMEIWNEWERCDRINVEAVKEEYLKRQREATKRKPNPRSYVKSYDKKPKKDRVNICWKCSNQNIKGQCTVGDPWYASHCPGFDEVML